MPGAAEAGLSTQEAQYRLRRNGSNRWGWTIKALGSPLPIGSPAPHPRTAGRSWREANASKRLTPCIGIPVAPERDMTIRQATIRISGTRRNAGLRSRSAKLVGGALARLSVEPVKGEVAFFDDNGPRGGRASRCALTVRLPYRSSIRVERTAETPRLALDAAFPVLERRLRRYRERDRDSKRHPKKYFAARRAR